MNKINLTLDNLVYNLAVNSSDDLTFVLPLKTPNVDLEAKTGENAFASTTETIIKVYIKTKKTVPTNAIVFEAVEGQNVIVSGGQIQLIEDTVTSVTCSTTDGGHNWLVNSCNAASDTAEGALALANSNYKAIDATNGYIHKTIEPRIEALENDLTSKVNTINDNIDTLNQKIDDDIQAVKDTEIKDLQGKIEAIEAELAKLTNIDILKDITKANVDNINKIPEIETNVAGLTERVATLEAKENPSV